MKLIIAIIRPEKLEAVQAALNEKEVYLMTASDVRGCARNCSCSVSIAFRYLSSLNAKSALPFSLLRGRFASSGP